MFKGQINDQQFPVNQHQETNMREKMQSRCQFREKLLSITQTLYR